jgi:hypothetical protein
MAVTYVSVDDMGSSVGETMLEEVSGIFMIYFQVYELESSPNIIMLSGTKYKLYNISKQVNLKDKMITGIGI